MSAASKQLDPQRLDEWMTELLDGELSEELEEQLRTLCEDSPERQESLARAERARSLLQQLPAPELPAQLADKALRRMRRRRRDRRGLHQEPERFQLELPTLVCLLLFAMSWLSLHLHQRVIAARFALYSSEGPAVNEDRAREEQSKDGAEERSAPEGERPDTFPAD